MGYPKNARAPDFVSLWKSADCKCVAFRLKGTPQRVTYFVVLKKSAPQPSTRSIFTSVGGRFTARPGFVKSPVQKPAP